MTKITINIFDPTPLQKKYVMLVFLSRGYSGIQIEKVTRKAITKGMAAGFRGRIKERQQGIDLYIYNILKDCENMDMPLIPNPNGYVPDTSLPTFNRRLEIGIERARKRIAENSGPPEDVIENLSMPKKKRAVSVRRETILSRPETKVDRVLSKKVQKKQRVNPEEHLIEYVSDVEPEEVAVKEESPSDNKYLTIRQQNISNRVEPESRIETLLEKTGVRELPEGYDPYNPDRPYLPTTMIHTQDNTCRHLQKNNSDASKVLWCNAFIPVQHRKENPSCCLTHRNKNGLTSYRPASPPPLKGSGALPKIRGRAKK